MTTWTSYDDAARVVGNRARDGWTEQPAYDPAGRPVTSTDALGNSTKQVYDLAGQLIAQRDEVGRWTYHSYDNRGRVTQTRDNLGNLTTMAYDAVGNLTARTDALNRTTTYQYDTDDRQTVAIDPLGRRVTTSYDAAGNVSTVTDPMNRVTSYTYDALNRQTKVTEAVGTSAARTRETSYDEVGNVKTQKDALTNVTTYSYDARNLQTGVQDPLGHRVTTSYDAAGQPTSVQDALGKVVTYTYDALHRRVATQDQLGHRTTVVLTGNGQQAAGLDALGNATVVAIDALGRPVGKLDALGGFSFSQPDGAGMTRLFTDPVGNEWHYVYDGMGREAVRHDPAGEGTTTAYDAVGRTTSVTDRSSRVIQYGYDNGDRQTAGTWKSAAGVTVNLLTFTYDDNDNQLTAKDYSGAVTYTYDELNRAKNYTNVFGQVLTYSYDAEDRVTKREDSLGGVLTSTYNAVGMLTSRQHGGVAQTEVRFDLGYSSRDEQSTITRYSDVAGSTLLGTTTYSRDDAGRLTGIVTKSAANATLSYYNYGYDNADRVTTHSWSSQIGTTTYSGTKTYTYDATSQLTNDSTTTYGYDANGNRTMAGYQTGTANRMTSDGVFTYTYDDEGNTLTRSKGAGLEGWFYTWDNANRLTNVRKTSNGTTTTLSVTYTYDVQGHRVQEDKWKSGVGSTTTRFAWDGQDLWADLDGSNALQVRYVHNQGIDQPLVRIVSAGTYAGRGFFLTDSLGTVRDVADGSMVIQYHADPDGFGALAEVNAVWGGRFKYTAREYDADTGLQDNRERVYTNGRWLTEDPIRFRAGDTNLYRYVGSNPTNSTDPFGQDVWDGVANLINYVPGGTTAITSNTFGAGLDFVDTLFAGWANALTFGYSNQWRENLWGDAAMRDQGGWTYWVGGTIGNVHNVLLTVVGAASVARGLAALYSSARGGGVALQMAGGGVFTAAGTTEVVRGVTLAYGATIAGSLGIICAMSATPPGSPQGGGGAAPTHLGNNPRPASGRVNTDLPGGEQAARRLFDQLTGGTNTAQPSGQLLGPGGHRLRLGNDGRWRVEIPAHNLRFARVRGRYGESGSDFLV